MSRSLSDTLDKCRTERYIFSLCTVLANFNCTLGIYHKPLGCVQTSDLCPSNLQGQCNCYPFIVLRVVLSAAGDFTDGFTTLMVFIVQCMDTNFPTTER